MNDLAYTLHLGAEEKDRDKHGRFKKGGKPWNYGMSWEEQGYVGERAELHKKKLLASAHKNGYKRNKIQKNAIPVIQMDEYGNRLHWYESSGIAAKKLGLCDSNIRKVCRGERDWCGGFRWKYDERFLT